MATLISPGSSVTITDDSFYIPASAPTVPLFFVATRADKKKADGITDAPGAKEHSIVRTITSLRSAVDTYGVADFRRSTGGAENHGDCRNEYGIFALQQALSVISVAYVVRADIDLADADIITLVADTPVLVGAGNGTINTLSVNQSSAIEEQWTINAISTTEFSVTGFLSGAQGIATVGVPFSSGDISFNIAAGSTAFSVGDTFTFNVDASVASNPLGANDDAKRASIVVALKAEINSNEEVRSELYEYNLILCPGYHEVVPELLDLNVSIKNEAFVIGDTPFNLNPEDTVQWGLTIERARGADLAYYYPHGIASNLDGRDVFVASSGNAFKQIAYSDSVSEVWFPPAGFRRGVLTGVKDIGYVTGVLGTPTTFVSTPLSQGQRDILYDFQSNINPIPYFPGRGITVIGQRTSYSLVSALSSINVYRLLAKVKRDIRKASYAYLHELNDRLTRESIKSDIDNYLNDILIRRGIYDFITICDESNNTPDRIDRGELWVDIAISPARGIEFIYIPIRVVGAGGLD